MGHKTILICAICGSNKTQNSRPRFVVCEQGHKSLNPQAVKTDKEKEERKQNRELFKKGCLSAGTR